MMKPNLSIVLGVTGKYPVVDSLITKTIASIAQVYIPECELVVVYNDQAWLRTPFHQMLPVRIKQKIQSFTTNSDNLALMYNEGIAHASSSHILFLWPGCEIDAAELSSCVRLLKDDTKADSIIVFPDPRILGLYGIDGTTFIQTFFKHLVGAEPILSLPQSIIPKQVFEDLGLFSTSELLTFDFQREFFLSAYQAENVKFLPSSRPLCAFVPDLTSFIESKTSKYISHALSVRCGFKGVRCDHNELSKFLSDIPQNTNRARKRYPIRVVLVSGLWEYHHNKLTFLNYFRALEGEGLLTFVPRLEANIVPEIDLVAADLVIISRGRTQSVLNVLDYCHRCNIPTLYMIDDNWLSMANDYPEIYGEIFSPESQNIKIFLECLQKSSAVIVYNRILEEDIRPYARKVIRIPPNISSDDFLQEKTLSQSHIDKILDLQEWRKHSQGLLIGYAGSARFVDTAFQALANVAIDPTLNVKLLLFGNVLPSHQKFFETKSVKFPFVEYEEYVQIMRFIKPDILVAPLEKNRTSMSKCPNKYLEYAIIGSAGIYSDVYPYSEFITHRSNGLLVPPDASVSEWTNAIVELIRDNNLRTKISSTARLDVMNNYETRKVLPLFLDVIQQVADCRTL